MSAKISPVSREVIIAQGGLWFERIETGFDGYLNELLLGTEAQLLEFLAAALKLNGPGNSYADFYYGMLSEEERARVCSGLDGDGRKLLELFWYQEGMVYYPLNETILPLLLMLSAREVLFSTFYFTKYPCTVWGNYHFKFPIFYQDTGVKEVYHGISCGGILLQGD